MPVQPSRTLCFCMIWNRVTVPWFEKKTSHDEETVHQLIEDEWLQFYKDRRRAFHADKTRWDESYPLFGAWPNFDGAQDEDKEKRKTMQQVKRMMRVFKLHLFDKNVLYKYNSKLLF